jgi:hypothetical protein
MDVTKKGFTMLRKTGLNQSLEGCRKDKNKRRESLNSAY